MKTDFDYNTVPHGFLHCFNLKCPHAKKCVRNLVTRYLLPTRISISIVNPTRIADNGKDCTFFMADQTQVYALGTQHLLDKVPHSEAITIRQQMISHFGQNNYYRFRKGVRLVSPSDQKYIRQLFLSRGIKEEPVFDAYIEQYKWD